MDGRLPLPTLLSHALVAFTIEFDNEFEHQTPHRTTNYGSTGGPSAPWLVSMVIWTRFLRHVGSEGVTFSELQSRTRLKPKELRSWLTRLSDWWGYLVVEQDVGGKRTKQPSPGAMIRPTTGGRKAFEVWRSLSGIIEKRWEQRFGEDEVNNLRNSLSAAADGVGADLPGSMPMLGYGLFTREAGLESSSTMARKRPEVAESSLPALLSKVLLAFSIEFERESKISLAICANVLRIMGEDGVPVRDLPRLTCVSKEAIAMSQSFLEARGYAAVAPASPGSRVKALVLTSEGKKAQEKYRNLLRTIEEGWESRLGKDTVITLRERLERLAGEANCEQSPLLRGLEPYPDGWRALTPRPQGLPHFPMILHRGGFPDGS